MTPTGVTRDRAETKTLLQLTRVPPGTFQVPVPSLCLRLPLPRGSSGSGELSGGGGGLGHLSTRPRRGRRTSPSPPSRSCPLAVLGRAGEVGGSHAPTPPETDQSDDLWVPSSPSVPKPPTVIVPPLGRRVPVARVGRVATVVRTGLPTKTLPVFTEDASPSSLSVHTGGPSPERRGLPGLPSVGGLPTCPPRMSVPRPWFHTRSPCRLSSLPSPPSAPKTTPSTGERPASRQDPPE